MNDDDDHHHHHVMKFAIFPCGSCVCRIYALYAACSWWHIKIEMLHWPGQEHQIIMRIDLNAKRLEIDHDRSRNGRSGSAKDTDSGDTQRTKKTSKIEEHKSSDSICEVCVCVCILELSRN